MNQVEELTQAAAFAAELEGRGAGALRAIVVPITFRLPVDQIAAINALAEHSGKSRVYTVSNLLAIALETLRGEVDKPTQTAIRKLQAKHVAELLKTHSEEGAE